MYVCLIAAEQLARITQRISSFSLMELELDISYLNQVKSLRNANKDNDSLCNMNGDAVMLPTYLAEHNE